MQDAELLKLCEEIVATQREEIAIMKRKLRSRSEAGVRLRARSTRAGV